MKECSGLHELDIVANMISSAEDIAKLLKKLNNDHSPVVVALSLEGFVAFRFKGFITDVSWPKVRVEDGFSNLAADLRSATVFERLEPSEASPDIRLLMEVGFISLLRAALPYGEIFFAELRPKDTTN